MPAQVRVAHQAGPETAVASANPGEPSKGQGRAKVVPRESNLLDAGFLLVRQGRQVPQSVQRMQFIGNAMDMAVTGLVPPRIDERGHPAPWNAYPQSRQVALLRVACWMDVTQPCGPRSLGPR